MTNDISFDPERYLSEMLKIRDNLKKHRIPFRYPDCINRISTSKMLLELQHTEISRDTMIQLTGYSLVSKSWLEPLADWIGNRKCLEIMAGNGILSYGLRNHGIDVIATGDGSWEQFSIKELQWCDIGKLDCCSAIENYKDRAIVICSWPPMDDSLFRTLQIMRAANPDMFMIYIGESGGCTADYQFEEVAQCLSDPTILEINKLYQSWGGLHDKIYLIK